MRKPEKEYRRAAPKGGGLLLCLLILLCGGFAQGQDRNNSVESVTAACWRNALAAHLGIPGVRLLLYPGSASVGTTSRWLWDIFDALTVNGADYYFNPAQYNRFSTAYGQLLYQSMVADSPKKYCDLNTAIIHYYHANGSYCWNKTIDSLTNELQSGVSMTIRLDTFVVAAMGDSITVSITANCKHLLVFYSYPCDAEPAFGMGSQPWYMPCALKEAYMNKKSPYWEGVFGTNGYMQKISVALVVVDSGTIEMAGRGNSLSFDSKTQIKLPVVEAVVICPIQDFVGAAPIIVPTRRSAGKRL